MKVTLPVLFHPNGNRIMKKVLFSISVIFLLFSCAGQIDSPLKENAVKFTAEAVSTRTAFSATGNDISTVWTRGDTIGIWCKGNNRGNFPYTAVVDKDSPNKAVFEKVRDNMMFYYDGTESTYYAYYPYRAYNGNTPLISFELPSQQVQAAAGDVSHLKDIQPFRARPVNISGNNSRVPFAFTPILSTIHLGFKMEDGTEIPVPVKKVKLISTESPLASSKVSLDLSDGESVPFVESGELEVSLVFSSMPQLCSATAADTYFAVLPGKHEQGVRMEVTAIDGSVASVTLPTVTFRGGNSYSRSLTFAMNDFVQPVPFDIAPAGSLTVNAGEEISFNIYGSASKIDFWSGEMFHDYAYSATDRILPPEIIKMSFLQALLSGEQPDCLDVKLSTDYDGTLTEAAIQEATWQDISDDFNLVKQIETSGNPNTAANYYKFRATSEVPVSNYADGKPFRIALFWHAYPDQGGRTVSWITGIKLWDKNGILMEQQKSTNPVIIEGASYGSDTNHCSWYDVPAGQETNNCFRFFSVFNLTGTDVRHAYAVINNEFQAKGKNVGHDNPFSVQSPSDDTPAVYSYSFAEPGTYEVVFSSTCTTLTGEKQETRSFTVTVLGSKK